MYKADSAVLLPIKESLLKLQELFQAIVDKGGESENDNKIKEVFTLNKQYATQLCESVDRIIAGNTKKELTPENLDTWYSELQEWLYTVGETDICAMLMDIATVAQSLPEGERTLDKIEEAAPSDLVEIHTQLMDERTKLSELVEAARSAI